MSSPRCLLHCLQVNTGATRACLCLCSKQPSLLWLQSKQVRQHLHMSSFVLIRQRQEGTGDSCSLISGGIQTRLHTGRRQTLQRRLKVVKLLLSAVLYSFILSFSILDCSHWTVGGITRHSAQGAQGGVVFCWESGQEKRPLCHRRHDVLQFFCDLSALATVSPMGCYFAPC